MSFSSTDVRTELGSPSTSVISSATLTSVSSEEGSLESAAQRAAEIISRKFALEADKSIGDVSIEYQARSERWAEISQELEDDTVKSLPDIKGVSSDPYFTRDMFTDEWSDS